MSLAHHLNQLLPPALRPVELATARYLRWSRGIVQAGPFRGMRYIARAHGSALAPKIAGTYEQEIQPYLAKLRAINPDVFVDIGAAEGYYAVGAAFARWFPRIIAYESDDTARRDLAALMTLNQVDPARIDVRGTCAAGALNTLLADCLRPAVLMDAEGHELLLLDPLRVPHLARCHLLVEHHDFLVPGLRDEICQRMGGTHDITLIEQAPRRAEDLACADPFVRLFPSGIRRRVLGEQRPFTNHGWLWLTPRPVPATL